MEARFVHFERNHAGRLMPTRCEGCDKPWTEHALPVPTQNGAFVAWCCFPCSMRIRKRAARVNRNKEGL